MWLSAVVGLALVFILVFEHGTQSVGLSAPLDAPMLGFEPDNITSLAITVSNFNAVCVRRDQTWFLTSPVETRANGTRILKLIDALRRTRQREVISPETQRLRGLSLASFGLDHPRAQCVVGYDRKQDGIAIGQEAPLGDLVYVRLNGGGEVLAVTREFESALPSRLDDLRDRAVFPPSLRMTSRIEIKHAGGFIQLAWVGGEWRIQQPRDARADPACVEWLLGCLRELRVEAFGGETPSADPVAYGLGPDEAALVVTVWPEGSTDGVTLTVGKAAQGNPSLFYARISDMGAIGMVGKTIVPLLGLKAEVLRDRRLCDADPAQITSLTLLDGEKKLVMERQTGEGWVITEPLRSRADSRGVGSLLKAVCVLRGDELAEGERTNSAEHITREAVVKLTMADGPLVRSSSVTNGAPAVEADTGRKWSYWVGTNIVSGSRMVLRQADQRVFRVPSTELLRALDGGEPRDTVSLADPMRYMDRGVFDLEVDHVRRLTLAKEGRAETVVKDSDGNWSVDSPPGAKVSEAAITALLALAGDLKAVRIESVAATNGVQYGFDETSPRLTFGLTGSGGIQKTILLGGVARRQGVYAMVQGRDVVFVLPKAVAEELTRSMLAAP
jgi:hypothetical protein